MRSHSVCFLENNVAALPGNIFFLIYHDYYLVKGLLCSNVCYFPYTAIILISVLYIIYWLPLYFSLRIGTSLCLCYFQSNVSLILCVTRCCLFTFRSHSLRCCSTCTYIKFWLMHSRCCIDSMFDLYCALLMFSSCFHMSVMVARFCYCYRSYFYHWILSLGRSFIGP